MKVSEVTISDVKQSIGYSAADCDRLLDTYLAAARALIRGYTKLTDSEIDEHDDLTTALLCAAGDMFENRSVAVNEATMNPTVKIILNLYAKNHI